MVHPSVKWVAALSLLALPFLPRQARPIAFVGVNVLPMDREVVLAGQTVVVDNGRIIALGDSSEVRVPGDAQRIEGRGRYLMPGLADMHVHLVSPLLQEDIALLLAANGVTTARNMWGFPEVLALRERIAAGEVLGPRIFTAGPITDGEPPVWPGSRVVTTAAEAEAAVREDRRAGYDAIKVYSNLSLAAYQALTAAAHREGLPVWGHVPDVVGLDRAIAAGQRSIEHLQGYPLALQSARSPYERSPSRPVDDSRAVAHVDSSRLPAIVEATRAAGVWNVPTLVVNQNIVGQERAARRAEMSATRYVAPALLMSWDSIRQRWLGDFSAEDFARYRRLDSLMSRVTEALHAAGAGILVGTDAPNPYVVPGFAVHEELTNLMAAGFTPYQALRAATVDPARFLGRSAEFGTVAIGQRADLLLLEANPLADLSNAARRVGVMVNGRWHPEAELQARLQRMANRYQDQGLLVAAYTGDTARIATLLARGARIDAADSTGLTPLMAAAYAGHAAAVRALAGAGAALNQRNESGQTALVMAAYAGRMESVDVLVARRADVNAADRTGLAPLMAAAYAGHLPVVRSLLEAGADASLRNSRGQTALDLAEYQRHRDIMRLLRAPRGPR